MGPLRGRPRRAWPPCCSKEGIYAHQTAEVEEEVEGDDGEITIKKKTTGGDPDLFKFFLERAWQLAAERRDSRHGDVQWPAPRPRRDRAA